MDILHLENRFLRQFDIDAVRICLLRYAQRCGIALRDLCANLTEIVLAAALTDPVGLRFLSTQSDSEALIQARNWGDDPIAPFLRRVCRENAAALLRIQTLMRADCQ